MKLGELAARLGCKLQGDENVEVRGVAGIESAQAGEVTFLSNPRYSRELTRTLASAVFLNEKVVIERGSGLPPLAALRSQNPYFDFARAIELFCAPAAYPRGFIQPPSSRNRPGSARGRTLVRTALWTKAWKSAAARCCTAS